MPKIPFSVYDFFGYLAAGVLACVGVDFALDQHWIPDDKLPLQYIVFWVVVAYIAGHINANLSSFFLERLVALRVLGRPTKILMGATSWLRWIFPGYFTPLPRSVQERIRTRAREAGESFDSEALFHHVRTIAKRDGVTWGQMQVFLQQYGFCRNVSFVLLVMAPLLYWSDHSELATVSLISGLLMFYRYLKFFRQYASEMLSAYPDIVGSTTPARSHAGSDHDAE